MFRLRFDEDGQYSGELTLRQLTWRNRLATRPSVVSILPSLAPERALVERFITEVYARAYGARIRVQYPVLMSIRDRDGKLLAALGFRPAAEQALFLERYLEQPVESLLVVPRSHIVEIGNLASAGGGTSLFLYAALAAYLHHKGFTWAVATGTGTLEQRLVQLGLQPRKLACAAPLSLQPADEDWGRYYEARPSVLAGSIETGLRRLQRRLGADYRESRPRLFPRLHYPAQAGT